MLKLAAVPISLATTLGISVDFFSCSYLDVSVRRVRFTHLCIQCVMTTRAGFPHSEICGSKCVCSLPAAYRKLLRPSSPDIAKASTMCTYSLVPITLASHALSCARDGYKESKYYVVCFDTIKTHQHKLTTLSHHRLAPINLYFFQIVKEQKTAIDRKRSNLNHRQYNA